MIFSLGSTVIITLVLYFVINFERDNHRRTLINRLVSSSFWVGIFWNIIMQPLTFVRYIIGPLNWPLICGLETVLRNGICLHGLLLLDSIILVKFIFLFYLTNPTALDDKFWIMFINLWIGFLSFGTQILYMLLPGKNPINYYMCTGHYPSEIWYQPVKPNWIMLIAGLCGIMLHFVIAFVKFKAADHQEDKNLFSKTSNSVGISSLICVSLIVPALLNTLEPPELDEYPNYLLLYVLHHYLTQLNLIVIVTAYFYKNMSLRSRLLGAFKNVFEKLLLCNTDVTVVT